MNRLDTGKSTKYNCGGFEIKGDCNKLICTHTFSSCKKSTVGKFLSIKDPWANFKSTNQKSKITNQIVYDKKMQVKKPDTQALSILIG